MKVGFDGLNGLTYPLHDFCFFKFTYMYHDSHEDKECNKALVCHSMCFLVAVIAYSIIFHELKTFDFNK